MKLTRRGEWVSALLFVAFWFTIAHFVVPTLMRVVLGGE